MYTFHPIISDWIIEDIRRQQDAVVAHERQLRLLQLSRRKTSSLAPLRRWLSRQTASMPDTAVYCSDCA